MITAVPADNAVARPEVLIATIVGALLVHVTFWLVALVGCIVAEKSVIAPMSSVVAYPLNVIPVAFMVTAGGGASPCRPRSASRRWRASSSCRLRASSSCAIRWIAARARLYLMHSLSTPCLFFQK